LVDAPLAGDWSDVTLTDISATAPVDVRRRIGDAGARARRRRGRDRLVAATHVRPLTRPCGVPFPHRSGRPRALHPLGVRRGGTRRRRGHRDLRTRRPERCSGLPVAHCDADPLAAQFATAFTPVYAEREVHLTPSGIAQPYTWSVLRRRTTAQDDPRPGS